MQTLSFDVGGMTCGGCTGNVQRALSKFVYAAKARPAERHQQAQT